MWTPEQIRAVPQHLLEWYHVHARPMPWNEDADPYHLLVAATMLQQTQVETVLLYLRRFLGRFPFVHALAEAEEEEVLRYWAGLGYYSRARNLHRTAQEIVQKHGGIVPCDANVLRQLPGVGDYTAGAVASIACGKAEPALDANGYRILARLLAIEEDLTRSAVRRRLWDVCRQILPADAPGDFNQALMDLGAMICTARSPRCLICPIAGECLAFQQGRQTELPVRPSRRTSEKVRDVYAVIEHNGRWLMMKRENGRLWRGMWEFPRVRMEDGEPMEQAVHRAVQMVGARLERYEPVTTVRHGVMHYAITLDVVRCWCDKPIQTDETARWVSAQEAQALPLPSPMRQAIHALIQRTPEKETAAADQPAAADASLLFT